MIENDSLTLSYGYERVATWYFFNDIHMYAQLLRVRAAKNDRLSCNKYYIISNSFFFFFFFFLCMYVCVCVCACRSFFLLWAVETMESSCRPVSFVVNLQCESETSSYRFSYSSIGCIDRKGKNNCHVTLTNWFVGNRLRIPAKITADKENTNKWQATRTTTNSVETAIIIF